MREELTAGELLRRLSDEIQQYPGHEKTRFLGPINVLEEPDEDGCNWSNAVDLSGFREPRIVLKVLRDAQKRYKVRVVPQRL